MTLCYLVFELLLGKRSELVSVFVDVYVTHCLSVFLVAGFAMGKIINSGTLSGHTKFSFFSQS
jgi:hypothetical protein